MVEHHKDKSKNQVHSYILSILAVAPIKPADTHIRPSPVWRQCCQPLCTAGHWICLVSPSRLGTWSVCAPIYSVTHPPWSAWSWVSLSWRTRPSSCSCPRWLPCHIWRPWHWTEIGWRELFWKSWQMPSRSESPLSLKYFYISFQCIHCILLVLLSVADRISNNLSCICVFSFVLQWFTDTTMHETQIPQRVIVSWDIKFKISKKKSSVCWSWINFLRHKLFFKSFFNLLKLVSLIAK